MVFKTISFGRSDNPPGAVRHPGSLPGSGRRVAPVHSRPRRRALSTSTTAKTSNPAPTGTSQPTAPTEPEAKAVCMKRSEEHTSELQSRGHLVCRLLLEKKNKQTT